jgi:hypothetical protein
MEPAVAKAMAGGKIISLSGFIREIRGQISLVAALCAGHFVL